MSTPWDQDCLDDTGGHRKRYGTRTYSDGCSWLGPQSPLPATARKAAAASNLHPQSPGTHCCVNPIVRRESSSTLTWSKARSGCLLSVCTVMLALPGSESFDDLMAGSQQANQRWKYMRCSGTTKRAASSIRPWWHNMVNSLTAFSRATSVGLGSSQTECRISPAATQHSPTTPTIAAAIATRHSHRWLRLWAENRLRPKRLASRLPEWSQTKPLAFSSKRVSQAGQAIAVGSNCSGSVS